VAWSPFAEDPVAGAVVVLGALSAGVDAVGWLSAVALGVVVVTVAGRTGVVSGVVLLAPLAAGTVGSVAVLAAGVVSAGAASWVVPVVALTLVEMGSGDGIALVGELAADTSDVEVAANTPDVVSPVDTAACCAPVCWAGADDTSATAALVEAAAVDDIDDDATLVVATFAAAVAVVVTAALLSATLTVSVLLASALVLLPVADLASLVLDAGSSSVDFVVFLLETGFCLELPGAFKCTGLPLSTPVISEKGVKPGATAGAGWAAAGKLPGLKLALGPLVG
jgi:hypothetical protein